MKEVLLLFFSLLSFSLSASTYYIAPTGNDNTGNGSASNPWRSLYKACSSVKTPGDIIHVNAGTYIETNPSVLAVNVSIEGEGEKSIIISHSQSKNNYEGIIQLISGTNNSQHISNLKIDGDDLIGSQAISVFDRDNVSIHDCVIVDFLVQGIKFGGGTQTGNRVYNNIITNCAGKTSDEHACLSINDNTGMLVYGNYIKQNSRPDGQNGICIESWQGLKACKIYDNNIIGSASSLNNWSFAIEFWKTEGGIEIYNNNISGFIDFGKDVYKGNYEYGLDFHHNTVGWDGLQDEHTYGIQFEQTIESVIIRNNIFKNLETPIYFCQYNYTDDYVKDIYIFNNLLINVGMTGSNYGSAIFFESGPIPPIYEDNINIWNNTIVADPSNPTDYGIWIPSCRRVTNVSIRNNIITGFSDAPVYAELNASSGTISTLSIENNLFYRNGNNNAPKYVNIIPTNVAYRNNIVDNPDFVSAADFHLLAESPAVGTGIPISRITTDFEGLPVPNPPNIGCYAKVVGTPYPSYLNSSVENATPSVLEMNYSLALANIVPATSAFSVQVNAVSRNVTSVSVSGSKVLLVLAGPVVYGNIVTVSYTAPSSNPLQTPAGGKAVTITARSVTNRVSPPPASPVYVSSAIENASPSVLEITYNLSLANIVPAISAFSVQVNSVARTVNSVTVSGTKVQLTLAGPVAYGNIVTVSYTVPSSNPLQTPAGGKAESISVKSVTNGVNPPPAIPVYLSSAIENAATSVIEMTYNLTLANIVPSVSAFSVQVNTAARNVTTVSVSGARVRLTLASPAAYGDVVTVSYIVPSSNPLQTTAGGKADAISAKSVTNKVNPPPAPAYVSSSVSNATPSVVEITFSLSLANIVPAASAFSVSINSVAQTVNAVAVSGTKVTLTLATPVVYGNIVTVSYTKPSANTLQTSSGGQAESISAQSVTNNVNAVSLPPETTTPPVVISTPPVVISTPPVVLNTPPVVVVNFMEETYSGFVGKLNASGSYDTNKDDLTYTWNVPGTIPVSATNGPVIEFLAPIVDANQTYDFSVTVSDGKDPQTRTIPVAIVPYQPGLEKAQIISIEAVDFQLPYHPYNIMDGNIGTMWSVNGNDQWIILELSRPFSIQHIELAFQPGQKREFYFDILGSNDKEKWEPILTKTRSCSFSGDLQVFEFPASKTEREYKYVKLVGQGNSTDKWNYIGEFRIFGYKHKNPADYEELLVKIYPNPARKFFNILIDEQTFNPDFIKIVSLTGKVIHDDKIDPGIRQLQIPVDFEKGIYIVQMGTSGITMFTQKLIVTN
jgi:uncharacterized repeat protein (TIGR02059 family)